MIECDIRQEVAEDAAPLTVSRRLCFHRGEGPVWLIALLMATDSERFAGGDEWHRGGTCVV